jgi:hypothetical protein
MLADQISARSRHAGAIAPADIIPVLESVNTEAADGLVLYLNRHQESVERLSAYWSRRREVSEEILDIMRTEEEAKADYASVSDQALGSYSVQVAGYHKSSKVLVNTVDAIVYREKAAFEVDVNTNPQSRATMVSDGHIWVSPRRLDGAIPGLLNPVALWEIKEYWGVKSGGSKMSDAIYELQLVGTELRMFEDEFGIHVNHYAIMDGRNQWESRKSDIRRAVDLLYSGILDELIVGREVLTEWPRILRECYTLAIDRGHTSREPSTQQGFLAD